MSGQGLTSPLTIDQLRSAVEFLQMEPQLELLERTPNTPPGFVSRELMTRFRDHIVSYISAGDEKGWGFVLRIIELASRLRHTADMNK